MPHYKLNYFPTRGRGETARILFALGGVEFENRRITQSDWPSAKAATPFGQIPVLEIDGVALCQSNAINRYLAKQFGYAGKTSLESAQCDMLADCMEELYCAHYKETDAAKKTAVRKKHEEETMPNTLAKLEKLLIANKGGDGYFVGDQLSWADVAFETWLDFETYECAYKVCWEKFPKLEALRKRVQAEPKIADWIAKRPATPASILKILGE